ncbi:MAG: VWA-like domain-containing protein, partial [Endomicrobiia bacterium]
GGTSSIPVFNYIKEKYKDKIKGLIFFTDLETDYPETKPTYKVYWVVTQEKYKDPPFGNVIHLTEK